MIPDFQPDGTLPPGIHWATWEEIIDRFGFTAHRRLLMDGLKRALDALCIAGCQTVYLDGSFVTNKQTPNDFDACWDMTNVDPYLLDPLLLDFKNSRAAQKAFYLGELFPAQLKERGSGWPFLEFFQIHKETGTQKGVIALDLRTLP